MPIVDFHDRYQRAVYGAWMAIEVDTNQLLPAVSIAHPDRGTCYCKAPQRLEGKEWNSTTYAIEWKENLLTTLAQVATA